MVDVGAAEGNFSLSVVEKADRIFLFETDKQWIEALEATFAPWKEKVTIVNKFVGDQTTGKFIRLDDFFKDLSGNYFLKVDVEGAESELIQGAENLFTMAKNIKAVICTYHKQNDQYEIDNLLKKRDFTTHFSDGFMLFYYDKKIGPPYFRKGLVRAEKNSKI